MSDWDEAMRAAALEHEAAEAARVKREQEERVSRADFERRETQVRAEYIRMATLARDAALRLGLPGAEPRRLRRDKKPILRPIEVSVQMLTISGAASRWYQVGEGRSGPRYSHPLSLWLGAEIPPSIVPAWAPNERAPYSIYKEARTCKEAVYGLDAALGNYRSFGQHPEVLVDLLRTALARWAVVHAPTLDLSLPA